MDTYVSIDIETDGPCPGLNSMLSLGAAIIYGDGSEGPTFYGKLTPLPPPASTNHQTMEWWKTQPEAWAEVTSQTWHPILVMTAFESWLDEQPTKPIAVAWPASFDFSFVCYYLWRFTNHCSLGYACVDMRSLAMGLMRSGRYNGLSERKMRRAFGKVDKTGLRPHIALDDAIEQGRLFALMLKSVSRSSPPITMPDHGIRA